MTAAAKRAPSKAAATWPATVGTATDAAWAVVSKQFEGEPRLLFRVLGPPVPKQRARTFFDKRVGKIVSKTPAKTESYEAHVAELARLQCLRSGWPIGGWADRRVRYAVWIDAWTEADMGDADNIAKSYKDALNGVAWPDDRRVCMLMVTKRVAGPNEPVGAIASIWALGTKEAP